MKKDQENIDPNLIIDIAVSVISDKKPTTLVGRILRWVKKLNTIRNGVGVKIRYKKTLR